MTAISHEIAKMQYLDMGDCIWGYSLKVGSSSARITRGREGLMGQHEARLARNAGKEVLLFVRHPLARLVSAYTFFTRIQNCYIRPILEKSQEDHDAILGKRLIGIEEWYDIATRYYNPHWAGQVEFHTDKYGFVPTRCLDLQYMPCTRVENKTKHDPWEDYYSPEFRDRIESRYADDLHLWHLVDAAGSEGLDTKEGIPSC